MADDQAPGRLLLGIDPELFEHGRGDLHVLFRLFKILFPLFPQVVVDGALESLLVDLHSTHLGFERLKRELFDLLLVHEVPPRDAAHRPHAADSRDSPVAASR